MKHEPSKEIKATLGITRQALAEAIDNCSFRWLLCLNNENLDNGFDCACCITWETQIQGCQCICHERIRELDKLLGAVMSGIHEHQTSWWHDRDVNETQTK